MSNRPNGPELDLLAEIVSEHDRRLDEAAPADKEEAWLAIVAGIIPADVLAYVAFQRAIREMGVSTRSEIAEQYSIDHIHIKTPPGSEKPWTTSPTAYFQRYARTEAGDLVGLEDPAGTKIRALEKRVRDRFVAEHPEWEQTSKILRLDRRIERAKEHLRKLLEDAAHVMQTAEELKRQRAELAGSPARPWTVVAPDAVTVLGRFSTEAEAADFITTLPDYLAGIYGLDGPRA